MTVKVAHAKNNHYESQDSLISLLRDSSEFRSTRPLCSTDRGRTAHLNGFGKLCMTGASGMACQNTPNGAYAPYDTAQVLSIRDDLFTLVVHSSHDVKHRKNAHDCQPQRFKRKEATRAYPAPEAKGSNGRITDGRVESTVLI